MMELLIVFTIVAVLDVAALQWGVDSRIDAGERRDAIR
jgi:hypothetical protein